MPICPTKAQRDFGQFRGRSREELARWLRGILLHNAANAGRHFCLTAKRQVQREQSLGKKMGEENGVAVRRDKAPFFSGCNSRPATFAPAGSNRSGAGGNESAAAFAAKDRQAVARASRP